MRRLRAGESSLAIHPGCGTNMATTVLLGASLGWLVMGGAWRNLGRLMRLPIALMLAVLGVLLGRRLGPMLQQKITTDADIGGLHVTGVRHSLKGRLNVHRVLTAG